MNRRVLAVVAVVAALGLAGCSSPAGLKALAREATAEDRLPDSMKRAETIDVESSRLLTVHDGVRYFIAGSNIAGATCIIVAPEATPDRWNAACGAPATGEDIVTLTGQDGSMTKLVVDGVDASRPEFAGWTKIHENVLIGAG